MRHPTATVIRCEYATQCRGPEKPDGRKTWTHRERVVYRADCYNPENVLSW
jgi:hypothetical protein